MPPLGGPISERCSQQAHDKMGARLGVFSEVETTKTPPPLPRTASAHAAPRWGAHRLPPSASAKGSPPSACSQQSPPRSHSPRSFKAGGVSAFGAVPARAWCC